MEMVNIIRDIACAVGKALGAECMPKPVIQPATTISIHLMSSILLDKLEEMGCDAPIYLPDMDNKVYRVEDVQNCEHLSRVSKIEYVSETMDCDDFAAMLFGKWSGLVWTNVHALNWFISDYLEFWFIEPQTRKLSKQLENWQGWNIRFFIGR